MVGFAYSGYIDLKWQLLIVVSCIIDAVLQVFVVEFVAFAIEYVSSLIHPICSRVNHFCI